MGGRVGTGCGSCLVAGGASKESEAVGIAISKGRGVARWQYEKSRAANLGDVFVCENASERWEKSDGGDKRMS